MLIENLTQAHRAFLEIEETVKTQPFMGLDCEWNPYGKSSPVALLQIATFNPEKECFQCYLFQLLKLKDNEMFRKRLRSLLNDRNSFKLGSDISNDSSRLVRDGFCDYKDSFVELKTILMPLGYNRSGIRWLSENVIGRHRVESFRYSL